MITGHNSDERRVSRNQVRAILAKARRQRLSFNEAYCNTCGTWYEPRSAARGGHKNAVARHTCPRSKQQYTNRREYTRQRYMLQRIGLLPSQRGERVAYFALLTRVRQMRREAQPIERERRQQGGRPPGIHTRWR